MLLVTVGPKCLIALSYHCATYVLYFAIIVFSSYWMASKMHENTIEWLLLNASERVLMGLRVVVCEFCSNVMWLIEYIFLSVSHTHCCWRRPSSHSSRNQLEQLSCAGYIERADRYYFYWHNGRGVSKLVMISRWDNTQWHACELNWTVQSAHIN